MRLREAVAISPCDAMEDSRGSSARRWMLPGRLRYTCREFTRSVIGNADVETPLELVVRYNFLVQHEALPASVRIGHRITIQ